MFIKRQPLLLMMSAEQNPVDQEVSTNNPSSAKSSESVGMLCSNSFNFPLNLYSIQSMTIDFLLWHSFELRYQNRAMVMNRILINSTTPTFPIDHELETSRKTH